MEFHLAPKKEEARWKREPETRRCWKVLRMREGSSSSLPPKQPRTWKAMTETVVALRPTTETVAALRLLGGFAAGVRMGHAVESLPATANCIFSLSLSRARARTLVSYYREASTECRAMTLRLACRRKPGWSWVRRLVSPPPVHPTDCISSRTRLYSAGGAGDAEPVTNQMIGYAFSHARSQRSDGSYSEALLVLEQGLSNLQRADKSCESSIGKIILAMSTLHAERGNLTAAVDKLQLLHELAFSSLALRVAALEAETGLHLQMGQDAASLGLAEKCLQLLHDGPDSDNLEFETLQLRAKSLRGLVELVFGKLESAKSYFAGFESYDLQKGGSCCGRVALSYGEHLHATGNLLLAKEFYEKALLASPTKDFAETSAVGGAGMVSEEVLLSANCALGQVATHTGKFKEAEEILTESLKKAEEHFGSNHPKVGVVLTCMADMFRQKGTLDGSSTLLIQEGLYRRAIDLMRAPALDAEDTLSMRRDIVALARGGYAEALCVQRNRKSEGEQMRSWAESAWTNRRLSLAQALDTSDTSNVCIVDTRIERVI